MASTPGTSCFRLDDGKPVVSPEGEIEIVDCCATLRTVVEDAIEIAKFTENEVHFKFGGRIISVGPEDNADDDVKACLASEHLRAA